MKAFGEPAPRPTAGASHVADAVLPALAIVLAIGAFAVSLTGGFVYDDHGQIVANNLIQDDSLIGRALMSDVWAFAGDGSRAVSNYWRPAFVVWLIANHRIFGLENPAWWHVTNLLLHVAVVGLAYALMRRLHVAPLLAGGIALLFAVHPTHVETVAWVSGSPSLIATVGMLAALLTALRYEDTGEKWALVQSIVAYVVAQLAKESSIVFPLILAGTVFAVSPKPEVRARLAACLRRAVPYAVLAAVFLLSRHLVLGEVEMQFTFRPGYLALAMTVPSLIVFYLKQAVWPVGLGPAYPLRPVDPAQPGVADFWLPLIVLCAALALFLVLVQRRPARQVGLLLFLLPLLPAMNINAFTPEDIAHDRYLYVSVLGLLMMLIPAVTSAVERTGLLSVARARWVVFGVSALLAGLMTVQTVRYSFAWRDDLSLWSRGVVSDAGSAMAWANYANHLAEAGSVVQAREAVNRSIDIRPLPQALRVSAGIALAEGQIDLAEHHLRMQIDEFGNDFSGVQLLAQLYMGQNRFNDVVELAHAAREQFPGRVCELASMGSIALIRGNRQAEAFSDLEAVQERVVTENRPRAKDVYMLLGMFYLEKKRMGDAREAFAAYLQETERFTDPQTLNQRHKAARNIEALSITGP